MSDGREVKTDCEAYLTYTMKSRMIFENLDSLKCQPYELLNLSFAWNFYSCDRKMDVLIYHDSFYEARHSGQLKLCIYCGVQWKGYTFHIDMLDKKIKSSEVRCNISTDQYIIVEPKAKKNTILIYGRDSSNVRQLRIRTIYVASERADSTSKVDKTPKLSSNPECDRKAGIKTATLKCEWKNTVAGLYQSSRVDLLEIHSAGSYMCQVRVFPAVCPTYDDKERIFHTNATSNVIAVTEDCISSLLKSLPTIPPKTSSLNFVLVIVFSCIIVLTAITVVVIYVARRNAKM
uniref:Ig-like domain-containing protein n=1 Tax=Romanomermis culicivorax TaxID=13658 RepID=A0A915JU08_ROMCU